MPSRVPRARALIAAACLAASIGAPGSALAQSAGDDQYQDPLAGQTTSQSAPPATTSTPQLTPSAGTGSSSGTSATTGTAATGTQTARTSATTSPTQATATSLPNTGVDGRILAALGAGLLLCGVGLRLRTARDRP